MAKENKPKTKRNKKIIERHDKLGRSFGSIGREFNISKARTYQIYIKEKVKALKK